MPRHPLDFVQCPTCTHVWNRQFRYDAIPYENKPNRMFNTGAIWKGHLAHTRDLLSSHLPAQPKVVEIGCGEGHFLRGLAEVCEGGTFVGFDPSATPENGRGVDFHARLFKPLDDMATILPDAVVIRHVLEHLAELNSFVEELAWGAQLAGKACLLFAEVPCIDRVFATGRLADFYFEHVSHFTSRSFTSLMLRAGELLTLDHGYDGEVVYALVRLGVSTDQWVQARKTCDFRARAMASQSAITLQLDELAASGKKVAIWGGTGKGAAFIHHFGADAGRFPLVVDSDPGKAGSYVPGTGQLIQYRDVLKNERPDVVIIPTQWRARDIVAEMVRERIAAPLILIEHEGVLIDFARDAHPYRAAPGAQ